MAIACRWAGAIPDDLVVCSAPTNVVVTNCRSLNFHDLWINISGLNEIPS